MALTLGDVARSFAQDAVQTAPGTPTGQEISPTGEYQEGVAAGAWMLYPSLFAGAVYDSNPNQTTSASGAGTNLRVSPRLVAMTSDGGIHATSLFGVGDFRFFNNETITAEAGFTHEYRPTQDLAFNANFRFTRQTDLFTSALNFNNNAIGPQGGPSVSVPTVINPFGATPGANPVAYNQFTVGGSATKTFGEGFASVNATAFHIGYDQTNNTPAPFNTSNDGSSVWLTGRVGYHFVPGVYAFAQAAGIWQRFNNSVFDTNGYRIVGGLGADDANSLFRGEVYGGYQFQHQQQSNVLGFGIPQNADSGVFGGRLYYYPTRYWTLIASVDQSLAMATQLAPSVPQGIPFLVTTAILQTTYGLSRQWSVGGRVGYTRGDYFGFNRLDTGWMAGASFNYEVWRNLFLTLDYQYSTNHSNLAFNDFVRNVYTAGVTYKY